MLLRESKFPCACFIQYFFLQIHVICSSALFDFVLSKVIFNTNISNYIIIEKIVKVTLCLSNDFNPKTLISLRKGRRLFTKLANFSQTRQNKECVTLWPCYLHLKVSRGKGRIMKKLKYFTMQKYNLQKIL
jgi:hypothetical protein